MKLRQTVEILGDMFFPRLCYNCGSWLVQGEDGICMHCLGELPRTGYHFMPGNPAERVFWGRVKVDFATSYLLFHREGMARNLLHRIKYHGRSDLAETLGSMFATELKAANPDFKPDLLIPIPLHPRKEKQRGFNQTLHIAKGIASVLGSEVRTDVLTRNTYTQSQTRKSRFNRWLNVENIFSMSNMEGLEGKSIVLIDDVITTGSTIEAGLQVIQTHGFSKTGVMSIAIAVS